jgi:hypothetical protein
MTSAAHPYPEPVAAEMLVRGVLLALGCALAQAALILAMQVTGLGDAVGVVALPLIVLAHGFFIVTLTDWGMRHASGAEDDAMLAPLAVTLAGTLMIGLVLAAAGLVSIGPIGHAAAPPLGLIGWTLIVVTALPARIVATVRDQPIAFKPIARRLPALLLAGAPVWVLGYLLSGAPGGMMEGGLIVMPFFFLNCFAASYLAALLPVAALR